MQAQKINSFKSIPEMVREASQTYSKQKAFTSCMPNGMNGTLSFAEVDKKSDEFAVYLREVLKIQEGDRVAVQMPNGLAYPVVAFGIFKAAAVLVNVNPLYTPQETLRQLKDAEAKALVTIDMFADKAEEVLKGFKIPHLVLVRIDQFFPSLVGGVIRLIQKVWSRTLPSYTFKCDKLKSALAQGAAIQKKNSIKVENYWKGLNAESLAVLQYTGGTTGVSKGAMLSHGNLMANVSQIVEFCGGNFSLGKECILAALPLYHIFAFTLNLLAFYAIGGRSILIPSPRPLSNLKRAFENYPLTWMAGVNTLFNGLNNERWFTDTPPKFLKASIAGGMSLQGSVAEKWEQITKTPIVEGYGLSETSPVLTLHPLDKKPKRNSIGIPFPRTQIRLVNEEGKDVPKGEAGELLAKGPQIMSGYWKQKSETEKVFLDGWFRTGDIAIQDSDGYYSIVDRKKDMILVSGFNVYPNEVEAVLVAHEKVLEAAVIGISDDQCGEVVKAFVVLGSETLSPEELKAHCLKSLTNYKVPKFFEFRAELPKTPVGKILRKDLRSESNK